jgi:hypothetical protein
MVKSEILGVVLTALSPLALFVAGMVTYVIPADAHRLKVRVCMEELPSGFHSYRVCHNRHIGEAGGIVATLTPTIPVEYAYEAAR